MTVEGEGGAIPAVYADEDTHDKRMSSAVEAAVIAFEGLSFGEMLDCWDLVLHRAFGASLTHLVNVEQLRLLRDLHARLVDGAPASEDLVRVARGLLAAYQRCEPDSVPAVLDFAIDEIRKLFPGEQP